MSEPLSFTTLSPDGDPNGVRIVRRMNRTNVDVEFPRTQWHAARCRAELNRTGVYILVGHEDDDRLPTLYIGEGDSVRDRIDSHAKIKKFWEHGYVFTTSDDGLNKAHVRWLEKALIQQARKVGLCKLADGTAPPEPSLNEAERINLRAFLHEIVQMLSFMKLYTFGEAIPATGDKRMGNTLNVWRRSPRTVRGISPAFVSPQWRQALDHLLRASIGIAGRPGSIVMMELIEALEQHVESQNVAPVVTVKLARHGLAHFGVKVEQGCIRLANTSDAVKRVFAASPWEIYWRQTLLDAPAARNGSKTARFAVITSRYVELPIHLVMSH